ncbi:MAG: hypothetical protein F4X81_06025 [Gammaproteobacteria bacterium]|nr:nucleotidyltransferase [Gammaproteobacteria bacterium]MDE2930707.1 nucleotidyltransferase [Chloroflexota bacterium]MYE51005.1 hypothetical protein [Gammaproteobacteria bacterium]MYF49915.1 hypothetical protein [Gammaproteobacteria bacterium]
MNGAGDLVVQIARLLDQLGIPYAVGGALALAAHGVPRATYDVDMNIGVEGTTFFSDEVLRHLQEKCGIAFGETQEQLLAKSEETGFIQGASGMIKVDLFFPNIDYLREVVEKALPLPLYGETINVIGPDDLIVMKSIFGRDKDFVDIQSLARYGPNPIDMTYISEKVRVIMHANDAERRLGLLEHHINKGIAERQTAHRTLDLGP